MLYLIHPCFITRTKLPKAVRQLVWLSLRNGIRDWGLARIAILRKVDPRKVGGKRNPTRRTSRGGTTVGAGQLESFRACLSSNRIHHRIILEPTRYRLFGNHTWEIPCITLVCSITTRIIDEVDRNITWTSRRPGTSRTRGTLSHCLEIGFGLLRSDFDWSNEFYLFYPSTVVQEVLSGRGDTDATSSGFFFTWDVSWRVIFVNCFLRIEMLWVWRNWQFSSHPSDSWFRVEHSMCLLHFAGGFVLYFVQTL